MTLKKLFTSSKKPNRVVVLGSGFIGGAIAENLIADSIEVLQFTSSSLNLLGQDIAEQLASQLRADDVLVFASAKAPCKNVEMLQENIQMAKALGQALSLQSIAHLIYISSDAVYKDSKTSLSEKSCAEPQSLHGLMHLAREIILRQQHQGPFTIVRPTLVYGINDPHNGYGPNRFGRLSKEGDEIKLFGKGEEKRDHVYVEDIAKLVHLLILYRAVGVVNAVSNNIVSFNELAHFAAEFFKSEGAVIETQRVGAMPHDGCRPFEPSVATIVFLGFQFRDWRTGLTEVYSNII
jgi:UDP-glucose 4-epimerase